jgi:hypothetical protein
MGCKGISYNDFSPGKIKPARLYHKNQVVEEKYQMTRPSGIIQRGNYVELGSEF